MNERNSRGKPRPARIPSLEADFWAELFLELTVSLEWLGQALDAIPKEDASAEAVVRLRSYSRALDELRTALERVQALRAEPEHKPFFNLGGPLALFLSRQYAWCKEIADDFERMATALRRHEPTRAVFSHKAVNVSYAQFDTLAGAVRRANEATRIESKTPAVEARAFDERLEELFWATEWLHLALARSPGE